MKAVLNPDTNEVLGFDDNMSDDQIHTAIQSDKDGRPMADVNPTPYDQIIRPALEQAKMTGNNQILYDARRRAAAEDPFSKALVHGATFGFTQDNDPEVKAAHGYADTLGNLTGQTASILATAGVGEILGLGKVAATAGNAAKGLLPEAVQAAKIGSGAILPVTAGELAVNTAAGVTSSAALGAMYNGITESVNQGKIFAADHTAPDVAKIGENILKGAVSWAPYGIGGAFIPKTAPGLAAGTSAVAGTAYVVSKIEGQSEPDARLNAVLMGIFHFTAHIGTLGTAERQQTTANDTSAPETGSNLPQSPMVESTPEMRAGIVEDLQNAFSGYTKAKNGMTEQGNLHQMVGDEFIKSEAQLVIDEQNANLMAAAEEAKARQPELEKQAAEEVKAAKIASEEKLAGTFKDPYEGKMLDYLSQFIPPKYIVRMDASERLRLANSPRKDLVGYKESYDIMESEDAAEAAKAEDKLNKEIFLRRTQNNTLQEVTSSDTLTKALTANVTKKVIAAQDASTGPEVSTEGAGPAKPAAPAVVPRETLSTGSAQPVDKKVSGLAQSVERSAIKAGLIDDFGELPSSKTRDMDDIAGKVSDFINNDYELAKKIALGEAPEQGDLRSQELFTGIRIKAEAEGDIETLRELATSEKAAAIAKEVGQRVKAYDTGEREVDVVSAIREVKKAREEIATKQSGEKDLKKETEATVKEIKKSIKKSAPKAEDWNDFLESIRC